VVKKVTQFLTDDGSKFDDEWKAKKHELALSIAKILMEARDECETVMPSVDGETLVNVSYLLLHTGFAVNTLNDIVQLLDKKKVLKNTPVKLQLELWGNL
jgi:hypothetical protein